MECLADKCTSWWWISQERVFLQLNESAHILHHIDFRFGRKRKINFEFPKLQNQKQHDAAQWHFWQQTQLEKIFKQANNAPLLLSLCSKSSSSSQSSCMFGAFFLSDWGVHVSCVLPTEIAFTLVIILMITSVTCWYMFVGGFQNVLNSGWSFSILVSDWVTDWLEWSDSSRRWRQLNTANWGQPDESFTMSCRQ